MVNQKEVIDYAKINKIDDDELINLMISMSKTGSTIKSNAIYKALNELRLYKLMIRNNQMIPLYAPLHNTVYYLEDTTPKNHMEVKGPHSFEIHSKEYLLSDVANYLRVYSDYEEAYKINKSLIDKGEDNGET